MNEIPVAKLVLEGRFGPKNVSPVDFKNGKFTFDRMLGPRLTWCLHKVFSTEQQEPIVTMRQEQTLE